MLASASVALAGGLVPSSLPALDPDDVAHFVIRDEAPGAGLQHFADGGRFGGDLDGDGADDLVLMAAVDAELEIWFGDPTWGSEGQDDDSATGDSTLVLPDLCLGPDLRIHYAALGDIDGDGFDDLGVACFDPPAGSALLLYFGHPQPWGGNVSDPDLMIEFVDGDTAFPGARVAGVGDLDGDGFDDFVFSGARSPNAQIPVAWVVHGAADLADTFSSVDDATWTIAGSETLRCLEPLEPMGLGDLDGDLLPELGIGCPLQPAPNPLDPSEDNELELGFSVFTGSTLAAAAPGSLAFAARNFGWTAGLTRIPQPNDFPALGDLDGDGFDEFGIVAYLSSAGSVSARVLAGGPGPFADIDNLTANLPFFPGDEYPSGQGVQLTAAGMFPGQETPAVWLRSGIGADSRVGLLADVDPSIWASSDTPPVLASFTPPGGDDPFFDWRFSLGGPGDADGDGVPDLLILSGFGDDDACSPEACAGAWLILCGDKDGDGLSACAGDCDDTDPQVAPTFTEQCDAIDHNCDGDDGQTDADGDGWLGCDGDCDDDDPARFPGANETCTSPGDLDCDGLDPIADTDGDGARNCEDCQPWNADLYPGAEEICDGLDTDCDGSLPVDEQDIDRDGWRACSVDGALTDCDDRDALVHPFRFEDCTNSLDDDCNGLVDEAQDDDLDGVSTCQGDCDDGNADVFPGAGEECDGLDNNCNNIIDDGRDFDGDGFSPCQGDCDNHDPVIHPGAVAVCEPGLDSNCDDLDDLADGDGDGFTACSGDCDDTDEGIAPTAMDWCDRVDNDCDGTLDDPFDLDEDTWADCLGDCADGASDRFPRPSEATCNDTIDDDCDGLPDVDDPDCPVEPPPELGPRPYGIACTTAGPAPASLLVLLLLVPLARRRRHGVRPCTMHNAAPLLLAAFALAPATADAARKEPGLVIYLSPQPDLTAMVAARDLAAVEGIAPEEVLHTSELLEGESEDRLKVLDAKVEWRCEMQGPPPVLGAAVDEALDALINLDPKRALRVLDVAIAALPCMSTPLPRRMAQNLFYYRGVANLQAGDADAADRDFDRTLAIQPDYPGDPNFPPEVGEAFEAVRVKAAARAPVTIEAFAPGSTEVRLDGVSWDVRTGGQEVQPGLHILQYRRGRFLWTSMVEIAEGAEPVAIYAGDQERALRDCVLDPAARAYVSATLGLAAMDAGVEVAALVDLTSAEDEVRWLYRAADDAFSFEEAWLTPPSTGGKVATGGKPPRTGGGGTSKPRTGGTTSIGPTAPAAVEDRIRLRISGGFAWIHPFPYAQIPLDFGVRLVGGLFLDVGLEASIAGPSDHGTVILPSGTIGFSYRFGTPVFQPRIGVLGRLALDDSATDGETIRPGGGWAGRVGFDIVPEGNFLFGFDVQGGMYKLRGTVGVNAGLGVRF
ncbi:MAG: hypothetical protein GY898_21765 [Proteobacteria bacterium]|nr:hypothetical protein [Pseudomonadota bacterium]